jgi:hypothetical protein
MFKIQRKTKHWTGNYWTTDDEWYEWEDMVGKEYATQDEATSEAMELADNPYITAFRVVHNDIPLFEYSHWRGQVIVKVL